MLLTLSSAMQIGVKIKEISGMTVDLGDPPSPRSRHLPLTTPRLPVAMQTQNLPSGKHEGKRTLAEEVPTPPKTTRIVSHWSDKDNSHSHSTTPLGNISRSDNRRENELLANKFCKDPLQPARSHRNAATLNCQDSIQKHSIH